MLRVKGDLATWFNASFMALFPRPLWVGLLFLRLWRYSSSPEKVSRGGVLDLRLYVTSSVSSEDNSKSGEQRLFRVRRNFFFSSSISRCMSLSFFGCKTWLFPRDWLLLVCAVCVLPSWSPLCWGFTTELLCWEPSILPDADQHYLGVGQSSIGANLTLPSPMLNRNLI